MVEIQSIYVLTPLAVTYSVGGVNVREMLVFADFVREKVFSLDGELPDGEVKSNLLSIISRKKYAETNNIVPLEAVEMAMKLGETKGKPDVN
jgi:hypothetical protein